MQPGNQRNPLGLSSISAGNIIKAQELQSNDSISLQELIYINSFLN